MQSCGPAVFTFLVTARLQDYIIEQNPELIVTSLDKRNKSMTRRDLIQKVLIGGTTFLILSPVMSSCSKDEADNGGTPPPQGKKITLDLTNPTYSALNTVGGFFLTQGLIIANTAGGYVAIDSTCTHQGCTIGYSSTANNFPCPCHGSVYSVTGAVLNGPTTVALNSYSASKSGNILTIIL